jgi:dephospho-CoA kinase
VNKYGKVIGFIGKSGSGKTYLANVCGEISGLLVFDHGEILRGVTEMPFVKQWVEYKRRKNMIAGTGKKVVDFVGDDDAFLRAQFFVMKHILNFKLKQKIDPETPMIVAFQALPMLPITREFGERVHIINPNDAERMRAISVRDGVPTESVAKRTHQYEKFLKFDTMKYDREFVNTGAGLPDGFVEYAESLRG